MIPFGPRLLICLWLIASSGFTLVVTLESEYLQIGNFVGIFFIAVLAGVKFRLRDFALPTVFATLCLLHFTTFGLSVIPASIGFLLQLLIALIARKLLPDFERLYIKLMVVLSILSLSFWVPNFLGADLQSIFGFLKLPLDLGETRFHIGIHDLSIDYNGAIRNMGMFWEPSAFGGYILLGLFFLLRKNQPKRQWKEFAILVLTLLSTQSTTAYVSFAVLVAYAVLSGYFDAGLRRTGPRIFLRGLIIILVTVPMIVTIRDASFVTEKIYWQVAEAQANTYESRINRIGNLLYDLQWVSERPYVGWSATHATRIKYDSDVEDLVKGQGNGLSGFAVKFGIIGLLVFLWAIFSSLRKSGESISFSVFGVIVVCLLLVGEQFLRYPVFLMLAFSGRK